MIAEKPPGHGMRPEPASRIWLADVRADMDAIFGSAPDPTDQVAWRTTIVRPLDANHPFLRAPSRRSRTMASVACTVAGLLIGLSAAGGLHLGDSSGGSALRPIVPPMAGVASNPFEAEPATTPVKAKQALATASGPPRSNAPMKGGEQAMLAKASTLPAPLIEHPREARPVRLASNCEGDRLERARCLRPDILDADRRLRRAYAEAIRQGVERPFLVEHQRRWARLRKQAIRDPDDVLEGYGELAGALERLSIHGRAANRVS